MAERWLNDEARRGAQPQLSVVIPTRNEEPNILPLTQALCESLDKIPSQIIYVDDSDKDKTPDAICEFSLDLPTILIKRRSDERANGLGGAVIVGFREAIGGVVAVMDGDLQHPVNKLPKLHGAIQSGYDIAIASRYMKEDGAQDGRSSHRIIISTITIGMARALFPGKLKGINDPTSGFFALRREILRGKRLDPIGFKILLDVLLRTEWKKVIELPIKFYDREKGKSKANPREFLRFCLHLWKLLEARARGEI